MELRNIERTTRDAVTTADTILLLKIDNAILKLDDGAVRRARTQTAWIFAVHALVFAQQPHQIAIVAFFFDKLDQVVVVPLRSGHRLIGVIEGRFAEWMIVPFNASDLASFAADAGGNVDVLAHLLFTTSAGAGHRSGMR